MQSPTMSESSELFVFINGTKLELMEDYRFPVYHHFPAGTQLYDPSVVPPRRISLSTDPNEYGSTECKLLPHAHYHAFVMDSTTQALYTPPMTYTCLYVSSLPPQTTPEMLGRFFEAFDMVNHADVFYDRQGKCTGRGWVVLQTPAELLRVPRALEFLPGHFVLTELSDRDPPAVQPPVGAGTEFKSSNPGPVSSPLERAGGVGMNCQKSISDRISPVVNRASPITPPMQRPVCDGPPEGALMALRSMRDDFSNGALNRNRKAYFALNMDMRDAQIAVTAGSCRVGASIKEEIYNAMNGTDSVYIIALLPRQSIVFGYARLLPRIPGDHVAVEWMQHGVQVPFSSPRFANLVKLWKVRSGSHLYPEVGQAVCDAVNQLCNGESGISVHTPQAHTGTFPAGRVVSPSSPSSQGGEQSTMRYRGVGRFRLATRGRALGGDRGGRGRGCIAPPQPLCYGLSIPVPASAQRNLQGPNKNIRHHEVKNGINGAASEGEQSKEGRVNGKGRTAGSDSDHHYGRRDAAPTPVGPMPTPAGAL